VPADSFHLGLNFAPEPVIIITFIASISFNAIEVRHHKEKVDAVTVFSDEDGDDGKQSFDVTVENYDNHFVPPIPEIRSLDGQLFDRARTGELRLKSTFFSDKDKKEELINGLLKSAINSDLARKKNVTFTLKRFNATRKYQFNVPMIHFNTNARQFPTDIHRLVLGIEFNSFPMYVNNLENASLFELKIPVLHDGEKSIKLKGRNWKTQDYHLNMEEVVGWTSHDEERVTESILEFDIQHKSLNIERCNPRIPVTKNISARISFNLVRYVLGPALTILMPIYVVTLLIPFCIFFDIETYSDIAGYLSSLLLTLVAHRQLMDQKQQSVLVITKADVDFFLGILFILVQMSILITLPTLVDYQKIKIFLFGGEEVFVLLWISMRFVQFYSFSKQNAILNSQNLLNQTDLLQMLEYRSLRCHRSIFEDIFKDISPPRKILIKTFFSLNVKLLIHKGSEKKQSEEHRFPTCDMFRMRIKYSEADKFLTEIEDKGLTLLYTKTIITGVLIKMVFQCSSFNNEIPLEVQIIQDEEILPGTHIQYKEEKLKLDMGAIDNSAIPHASFHGMLWLLVRSVFLSCTSHGLSLSQRMTQISTDIKLFRAINKVKKIIRKKNIKKLKMSRKKIDASEKLENSMEECVDNPTYPENPKLIIIKNAMKMETDKTAIEYCTARE